MKSRRREGSPGGSPAIAAQARGAADRASGGMQGVVSRWQREAGNAAVARALSTGTGPPGLVVARLRDHATWIAESDISIGPFRRDRSPNLQVVDRAVADYDASAAAGSDVKKAKLIGIEGAINDWRGGKGGTVKAEKKARGPHVTRLYGEVQVEKGRVENAIKKSKVEAVDPALLHGIPADDTAAPMLFNRFMAHFRGNVEYTLTTSAGKNPWDGGKGPYACGTFAKSLADFALAAGVPAKAVQVTPRNFVTPLIDGDFIDVGADGNVQAPGGARQPRYFFTEHWVTEISGQYFCPTSGKVLGGIGAAELVDGTIGQLKSTDTAVYTGNGVTVRKVGNTAKGGGLYEVSRT